MNDFGDTPRDFSDCCIRTSWMWRARLLQGGEVVGDLAVPTQRLQVDPGAPQPLVTAPDAPLQIAWCPARSARSQCALAGSVE